MSNNMVGLLGQARGYLITFSDQLGQIFDKVDRYHTFSALADEKKQQALTDLFNIQFTHTSGVTAEWSLDRVRNAYDAVRAIMVKLGGEESLANTFLFMQLFGGITFELSGKDPQNRGAFASTSDDGNIIYLYTEETSRAHTAPNIVHEFGHVLVFRHGRDASEIYRQWDQGFRQAISDFDTNLGWRNGRDDLQNKLGLADFGGTTSSELENERVANMFERWINGSRSDLNLDSGDDREKRAAWAMWSFMTGECPPKDFKINLLGDQPPCGEGTGFLYWLRQYGG